MYTQHQPLLQELLVMKRKHGRHDQTTRVRYAQDSVLKQKLKPTQYPFLEGGNVKECALLRASL